MRKQKENFDFLEIIKYINNLWILKFIKYY